VLITDAIAAAPRADGPSSLGELDLQVDGGAVRGPDGILAGSVLTMIEAVRNLHALGAPIEDAVAAATLAPARLLGAPDLGRLELGLPADVVILNDRLEIERVVVGGVDRVFA
jgi:N-acetylglucosamine-6-phosphate deacetylase